MKGKQNKGQQCYEVDDFLTALGLRDSLSFCKGDMAVWDSLLPFPIAKSQLLAR
jgi:hypothetical protein